MRFSPVSSKAHGHTQKYLRLKGSFEVPHRLLGKHDKFFSAHRRRTSGVRVLVQEDPLRRLQRPAVPEAVVGLVENPAPVSSCSTFDGLL